MMLMKRSFSPEISTRSTAKRTRWGYGGPEGGSLQDSIQVAARRSGLMHEDHILAMFLKQHGLRC